MPSQNLPRAMFSGTLIVLVLYVALNAVFLHTAPIDKLAGQIDVARIAGTYIFGEIGGRIVGAMICIGLISSISAMMWIGPRVMMTMGEDIPALRVFARKSTQGAPAYAILFQLAVATLMLFTRSFEAVLDFIQFALLFCSFFTVLGVDQAAHHAARSAAALPRLGIPGHPDHFPARDAFHDVLSCRRAAVAVLFWCSHHDVWPFDLRRFPQKGRRRLRCDLTRQVAHSMFRTFKIAAAAARPLARGRRWRGERR